jgi:hypothetical protein
MGKLSFRVGCELKLHARQRLRFRAKLLHDVGRNTAAFLDLDALFLRPGTHGGVADRGGRPTGATRYALSGTADEKSPECCAGASH